jgi:integrase
MGSFLLQVVCVIIVIIFALIYATKRKNCEEYKSYSSKCEKRFVVCKGNVTNEKAVKLLCQINKKLTHYVARHTFATTVTLGNGVSLENVSSMMGHTRISMTQHYAKVLDKNVKTDMDKLRSKFQ